MCVCVRDDAYVCGGGVGVMCVVGEWDDVIVYEYNYC